MEVFQECSDIFSGGQKIYQSLYTFDGQFIPSLDEIPEDCKLIIVSENPPLEPIKVELKSNAFEFSSEIEQIKHRVTKVEETFTTRKIEWFNAKNKEWMANTPFIYDKHKNADKLLQKPKTN